MDSLQIHFNILFKEKLTCWERCLTTNLIFPSSWSFLSARRASEPLTLSLSLITDGVINFVDGTSFCNLSKVALSKMTKLLTFSLVFPLDHFFFGPPCLYWKNEKKVFKKMMILMHFFFFCFSRLIYHFFSIWYLIIFFVSINQ